MQKEMHLGGALFELESVRAVPPDAQAGTWAMEWWWDQPNVPEVVSFVADFRKATGKTPSARHWFGLVAVESVRLAAEKAKTLDGPQLSLAMEGMELPPDLALSANKAFYRAGDHQLMCDIFIGDVHPPTSGNPDAVFTIGSAVPGEKAAGSVADTGCKMTRPA
jgi:branched-chain amino acid transport system substrate-binding protein